MPNSIFSFMSWVKLKLGPPPGYLHHINSPDEAKVFRELDVEYCLKPPVPVMPSLLTHFKGLCRVAPSVVILSAVSSFILSLQDLGFLGANH